MNLFIWKCLIDDGKKCGKTYKSKGFYDRHIREKHHVFKEPIAKRRKTLAITHIQPSAIDTLEEELKKHRRQIDVLIEQQQICIDNLKQIEDRLDKTLAASKKRYCIVCWEHESNFAFLPCGHKIVCGMCAITILGNSKQCPVCRSETYDIQEIWDVGMDENCMWNWFDFWITLNEWVHR